MEMRTKHKASNVQSIMKNTLNRVVMSIALAAALMITMLPLTAHAEDNRTEISQVTVTSDFLNVIKIGGDIAKTNVNTAVNDSRVYSPRFSWQKYNETTGWWDNYYSGNFTAGTWRCLVNLEVKNYTSYKLAEPMYFKVLMNGISYGYDDFQSFGGCYGDDGAWYDLVDFNLESKPITIGANGFKFYQNLFSIPQSTANSPISPIDLKGCLVGGIGAFSKKSGPAWIEVSSDGKITGIPNTAGENAKLVVTVSDNNGITAEATFTVGATSPAGIKNKITHVRATSNISTIAVEGHAVEVPTFDTIQGSPAIVKALVEKSGEFEGGCWTQKIGTSTYYYFGYDTDEGFVREFSPGNYSLVIDVIIPAEYTSTYEFDSVGNMDVLIDGQEWSVVNLFKDYGDGTARFRLKKEITVPRLVKSIKVTPSELELQKGESADLSVEVLPATASNKNVYWESDNRNIATVDKNGKVTTYSIAGTAIITVHADDGSGVVGTCKVTVTSVQEQQYEVSVINGTGSGFYNPRATVKISADTPEAGKQFKEWEGIEGIRLLEGSKITPNLVFIMPVGNVNVKATYEDIPLAPENPSGEGNGNENQSGGNNGSENSGNAASGSTAPGNQNGSGNAGNGGQNGSGNGSESGGSAASAGSDIGSQNASGNGSGTENSASSETGNASVTSDNTPVSSDSAQQESTVTVDNKQKNTSLSKLKTGKKSITVSWKKVTDKAIKGYEIQYSTDKKFKKDVKVKTINKAKTAKVTIKKLKSKKKYYIRIRTFRKSGDETICSKWSKSKSVKVK